MQVTHFFTGQRRSLKTMPSSLKFLWQVRNSAWLEFPENVTGFSAIFTFDVLLDFNATVPQVVRLNGLKGTHLRIAADFQALSSPWYEGTKGSKSCRQVRLKWQLVNFLVPNCQLLPEIFWGRIGRLLTGLGPEWELDVLFSRTVGTSKPSKTSFDVSWWNRWIVCSRLAFLDLQLPGSKSCFYISVRVPIQAGVTLYEIQAYGREVNVTPPDVPCLFRCELSNCKGSHRSIARVNRHLIRSEGDLFGSTTRTWTLGWPAAGRGQTLCYTWLQGGYCPFSFGMADR